MLACPPWRRRGGGRHQGRRETTTVSARSRSVSVRRTVGLRGDAGELALEIEAARLHLRAISIRGNDHGLAVAHHHAGEGMRKLKGVPRVECLVTFGCAGEGNNDGAGLTRDLDRARLYHAAR